MPEFLDKVKQANLDYKALCPFDELVPKDKEGNRQWREWLNDCAMVPDDRQRIIDACASDFKFFINSFLWIKQEEPFPEDLPFILWPRQAEYADLLCSTRKAVAEDRTGSVRGNIVSDKPRRVGWSWLSLAEGLHIVRFTPGATGIIGSRVADDVDKPSSSKSLFWKLDYFIEHLPRWLWPDEYWSPRHGHPIPHKKYRTTFKLVVPGGGTLLGGPTQANFARSGGFAWMMLDEFAHVDRGQAGMGDKIWSGTQPCRLRRALSTPAGRDNKFARLKFSEGSEAKKFTIKWHDDPAKTVGIYKLTVPMAIGPITLEAGESWSPYMEAARAADDNDALFAQEMLLSYEGIGGMFFDALMPRVKLQVTKPIWRGNIKLTGDRDRPRIQRLEEDPQGFLSLWEPWGDGYKWPAGLMIMGVDVASGSRDQEGRGASNSVLSIGRVEGQKVVKVAQYMTHGLMPHLLARIACALGWAFPMMQSDAAWPAFAIWEMQGPGDFFGNVLTHDLGYPHYYIETTAKGVKHNGFHMSTHRKSDGTVAGSKVNVFNEYKKWLQEEWYKEPSFDTYKEMEQYKYTEDAGPQHVSVKTALDPGLGRANHGDTVIATALMIWAAKEMREQYVERDVEIDPPRGTLAFYQKQKLNETSGAWPVRQSSAGVI